MRTPLSSRQARTLALGVAGLRVALGLGALAAPDVAARPWVGDEGPAAPRRTLARALGGRDVALGLGALLAARRGAPVRGWVEAGALADAGDVVATLASFPRLPRYGRFVVLAGAAGAVAAGVLTAPEL